MIAQDAKMGSLETTTATGDENVTPKYKFDLF